MSLVKKRMDQKETDEIDVGRLVGEIIDHRKLIVSVTALLTLLSFYMQSLQHRFIKQMHYYKLNKNKEMLY